MHIRARPASVCGWCQTLSHKDECPPPGISPGAECPLPLSPQLGLTAVLSSVHSLRVSDSLRPHVCSTPGLPVLHQLLERAQTHVHHIGDGIQPSHTLVFPFSSRLQSFPASGSLPTNQFFASGGQRFGVSTSASVFPIYIQD